MKKILFAAYSLDVGGIETSLVTLLNYLSTQEYEITLVLEKKQGIFLNSISEKINIIEYSPKSGRHGLVNKICNLVNRFGFIQKYKNRFDFSCAYATYSLPASFVARTASKNCALWVHNEYKDLYNKVFYHKFFDKTNVQKFKKIIFVSNIAKESFNKEYLKLSDRTIYCNNLLDYKNILKKSEEKINEQKEDIYTFLNVGRHDEEQKKLSRIIEAAKILKLENLNFRIILIGDGIDKSKYSEMIKQYNLKFEVIMLGTKKNPYPYFKISDCIILTSDYEGYPVVYNEAKLFNLPIITTNVSDAEKEINNRFGIVLEDNTIQSIVKQMRKAIKVGLKNTEKFDVEEYNKKIIKKIKKIIES